METKKPENEIPERELAAVSGGQMDVDTCLFLLHRIGLFPERSLVEELMSAGGLTLRNWALAHSDRNPDCNIIPSMD